MGKQGENFIGKCSNNDPGASRRRPRRTLSVLAPFSCLHVLGNCFWFCRTLALLNNNPSVIWKMVITKWENLLENWQGLLGCSLIAVLCCALWWQYSYCLLSPGIYAGFSNEIIFQGSVKTEAPPAADFGRMSGRSFGRGSSSRNSEYPVLTGPPVLARAPAISRSFDQIWSLFHQ